MVHRYNKDTQEKILKEANRLFMSKGYLGTSTREIARELESLNRTCTIILVIKKNYTKQFLKNI